MTDETKKHGPDAAAAENTAEAVASALQDAANQGAAEAPAAAEPDPIEVLKAEHLGVIKP